MSDIRQQLLIKFGLSEAPTPDLVAEWIGVVQVLIAQGISVEEAGRNAARRLFTGFGTIRYSSTADTVEALLWAAAPRAQRG